MENEKCPCCRADMHYVHNLRAFECGACPFRGHISYMPRIAAAMELARATATYAANIPARGYPSTREWDAMQDAEDRVIEVFGGE